MLNQIEVLVLKDENGSLRPQAGCWKNDEAGKINSEIYLSKPRNSDCSVVIATLTEKIK